jgi:hypothetical protein
LVEQSGALHASRIDVRVNRMRGSLTGSAVWKV